MRQFCGDMTVYSEEKAGCCGDQRHGKPLTHYIL
jgi:hypothetical protein